MPEIGAVLASNSPTLAAIIGLGVYLVRQNWRIDRRLAAVEQKLFGEPRD